MLGRSRWFSFPAVEDNYKNCCVRIISINFSKVNNVAIFLKVISYCLNRDSFRAICNWYKTTCSYTYMYTVLKSHRISMITQAHRVSRIENGTIVTILYKYALKSLQKLINFLYIVDHDMMTSSNWNIFRVTGPLLGHKGQWRGTLLFSLICAWTNVSSNNRDAGDLVRHRTHYDVTVMVKILCILMNVIELFDSFWLRWPFTQFPKGSNKCYALII